VQNFSPFKISFSKFGYFVHKNSCAVYLKPYTEKPRDIQILKKRVQEELALTNGENEFEPHLTVAQFKSEKEAKLHLAEFERNFTPIEFLVTGIFLINRRNNTPFEITHFLAFRGVHTDQMDVDQINNFISSTASNANGGTNNLTANITTNITTNTIASNSYKFNEKRKYWERSTLERSQCGNLKIATFNVLFDFFFKDLIHSDIRFPAIFETLANMNVDVIGLQEVTNNFLQNLIATEWVQKDYFLSEISMEGTYGQVILSKYPFQVQKMYLEDPSKKKNSKDKGKMVVLGKMEINQRLLGIAVIHLTSNRSRDASAKRQWQYNTISDWIQTFECTENFIIGDFNVGDETRLSLRTTYSDAWKTLKFKEEGHTYDPNNNPLAKVTAISYYSGRFDRILVDSASWNPKDISLFGTEPIQSDKQLLLSDHYGVLCELEFDDNSVLNNYVEKPKGSDESNEKKQRMRTAVEVYNRLKWDEDLDRSTFLIGYEDRFLGIMEVPFDEFDTSEIPFHRIRLYKRNSIVVWDREQRIDALFAYQQ